jgi:hypothetical protein
MARPQKPGLDYFALDVQMDDAVNIIEAEHGLAGFAIIIKLFQRIYNEGYYYKWTEKEQILFSSRVSVDRNLVTTIVEDCIKWGIFNQELYKNHTILTSRRIQNHYLTATYKRINVEMVKEYLLIDVSDRKNINVIRVSDDRNPATTKDTDDKSTQSKVKESKEKKSKEKEDTSLQIKNLRSRYSEEQSKVIDEYFDILRWTRKNGRIADSVILKIYQEWERYPIPKVIYALRVYINNPKYHDKRENYCYGIMRNVTADEIAKGEDYGKSKRDNGQDVDQYAGIGLTLEDLQAL